MKILCMGDTHCHHHSLILSAEMYCVDAVVHVGDCTNHYDEIANLTEFHDFIQWYSQLPIDKKYLIPGNHDVFIGKNPAMARNYCEEHGIELVINRNFDLLGLDAVGVSWTPSFGSDRWVFNRSRNKLGSFWKHIDSQYIFCHGCPKGVGDLAMDVNDRSRIVQVGDTTFKKRVDRLKCKTIVSGHIHDNPSCGLINHGTRIIGNTTYVNCSIVKDNSKQLNNPIILEIAT